MPIKNVLSVEGLSKRYGEKLLFEGLTFGLSAGQRVAIVAKNGAGKSTLMNALCGIEAADSGKITFSGDVSWSFLKQETDFAPDSTLLNTLYSGDTPAISALKYYERVISEVIEGEALQLSTD